MMKLESGRPSGSTLHAATCEACYMLNQLELRYIERH